MSGDMSLHLSSVLAAAPDVAPDCHRCRKPSTMWYTRYSNRKGNAGRPYYKCLPCGKFLVFADERGNDPTNALCFCGETSKRQVSGPDKRKPRQIHYVCRVGGCDFYKVHLTAKGEAIRLSKDLVREFTKLRII